MTEPTRIDPQALEALCQYGAPLSEIAAHLAMPEAELRSRLNDPEIAAVFERGEAKRNLLLRQARMKKALKGDSALLTRLSDRHLNEQTGEQTDMPTLSVEAQLKAQSARLLLQFLAKRAKS